MRRISPSEEIAESKLLPYADIDLMSVRMKEKSQSFREKESKGLPNKSSSRSKTFVERRRHMKNLLIQELLNATVMSTNRMVLNEYILGRVEPRRKGFFNETLKLLGLAELTCQEAVLNGSADELIAVLKRLTARHWYTHRPNPRRTEINGYDENGFTALSLAVKAKRFDMVLLLVNSKASLDLSDEKTGMSPLMYSLHNRTHEISHLLIKEGADVNGCDFQDVSPLMIACCIDDAEMTLALTANLANVDKQDFNGWTPLHYAAFGCSAESCRILISYGADRTVKDNKNRRALHIARYKDVKVGECIAVLEDYTNVLSFD